MLIFGKRHNLLGWYPNVYFITCLSEKVSFLLYFITNIHCSYVAIIYTILNSNRPKYHKALFWTLLKIWVAAVEKYGILDLSCIINYIAKIDILNRVWLIYFRNLTITNWFGYGKKINKTNISSYFIKFYILTICFSNKR